MEDPNESVESAADALGAKGGMTRPADEEGPEACCAGLLGWAVILHIRENQWRVASIEKDR